MGAQSSQFRGNVHEFLSEILVLHKPCGQLQNEQYGCQSLLTFYEFTKLFHVFQNSSFASRPMDMPLLILERSSPFLAPEQLQQLHRCIEKSSPHWLYIVPVLWREGSVYNGTTLVIFDNHRRVQLHYDPAETTGCSSWMDITPLVEDAFTARFPGGGGKGRVE